MNLINTIKEHVKKYPLMEVEDVCKLIYQSTFGGGHMIADSHKSLLRLGTEYEEAVRNGLPNQESPIELLGGDMCRIYLNGLTEGMKPETLNKIFVVSANGKKGTVEELEQLLEIFLNNCEDGVLPFDPVMVKDYITAWREKGFPAISHSDTYREVYFPAYRVVNGFYGRYYKVFLEIDRLLEREKDNDKPLIIAIDGMAGSGKSTLGEMLQKIYECNLFHMDDYFLQLHQRTAERLAEPGGNVDYERFKKEIYDQLEEKKEFFYQIYDCSAQGLGKIINVPYRRLNIIEGAYSSHPYFDNRADLTFFLEIPPQIQKERIAARNGEKMLERFLKEWIPMEHRYFQSFSIREKAVRI